MQTDAQKLVVVRDQFALKGLSDDALKQILPAYKEAMDRLQYLLRTMPPDGSIERELWLRTQLATIEAQFRPVADRIYQVLPEAQARAFEEGLTNARKYLEAGGIRPEPATATTTLSSTTIGGQQVSVTGNLPGLNVTSAVKGGFISPSITRQQIVAAARETGFSVLSPGGSKVGVADLLPKWMAAESNQVVRHLRAGFLVGSTNEEIMREIGPLARGRKGWAMTEAVVRTSMAEASQSAHDAFYEANEDLLLPTKSGYRWWWDASNDTRLCPVCAPLDGIKFKERDQPPHAWPAHFSCRCKILPWTATMELMEEENPAKGSFLEATPVEYTDGGFYKNGKPKPPKPKAPPAEYTGDNAYKRPMKINGKMQWVRRRDLGPGQTTAGDMLQNANEHSKKLVLGKHTEKFNVLTRKGGKYEKDPQGAVRELLGKDLPPQPPARPTRGPKPKPPAPAPKAPAKAKPKAAPASSPSSKISEQESFLKENSFAMPGVRFDGSDIGRMMADAATDLPESNVSRLFEFAKKDGQVVFVSQTEQGLAKRLGTYGVRDFTKKDVPWAMTESYAKQLAKAGIQAPNPKAIQERIDLLTKNESLLKEKISKAAARGWDDEINKNALKNLRQDLRQERATLKDLPRRLSSHSLGGIADGHTSAYARRVVITDDFQELLQGEFERDRKVSSSQIRDGIGDLLKKRSGAGTISSRLDSDTYHFAGKGRKEGVLYTYTHETGHQVYFRAGSPAPPRLKGNAPTGYAATNNDELFAESWSAYVFNPKALKDFDEALYDWVDGAYQKAMNNAGGPLF